MELNSYIKKMNDLNLKIRSVKNLIFRTVVIGIALLAILPLFFIIFYVVKEGIGAINWKFLSSVAKPIGESGGGILSALAGTFILILIAAIIAIPVGIAAGLYVSEHNKNKMSSAIRLSVEVLQGTPSIVIGIIGYLWFVKPMGHFSALSGGIALALMMLPMIVKTSEETLRMIPFSLKEASLALGVPYYKTILKVILPAGLSGIMTGVIVGLARIAGETAPLLFTAIGNAFFSLNILKPIDSLPLLIFNYATSPYADWHKMAWGASTVLIFFILILNLITRLIVNKWKIKY